jgi:hypothetical protein
MTPAAKSLYFFSIYLLLLSVLLIAIPNTVLTLTSMPETNEVWIRIVGVLVFSLGIYYYFMAPTNHVLFMTLTAYLRALIIVWFALFVFLGWVSPMLMLFGVIDLIGAVWTFMALRKG